MKLRISLLLALALMSGACQRTRLSPTVLTPPSPEKPVEKPLSDKSVKTASVDHKAKPSSGGSASASGKSVSVTAPKPVASTSAAKVESKVSKSEEAARLAAKRKRLAAARRAQAKRLAEASLEAGRQLLREEQNQSALKAFREAVRLNSGSAEAWMGVAYVSELSGNTKDAVAAFKEAKRLWGM